MNGPILSFRDVRVQFNGVVALDLPALDVFAQSPTAVFLGANGAGKSSLLNAVTGYAPISQRGRITLRNAGLVELSKLPRSRIVQAGIARTFQMPVVFASLTVEESLLLAAQFGCERGTLRRVGRLLQPPRADVESARLVNILLEEFALSDMKEKHLDTLSFVVLRRVELARALATQPQILFLDEPTAGADPAETRFLAALLSTGLSRLVRRLHAQGSYRYSALALGLVTHDRALLSALSNECIPEPIAHIFDRGHLTCTDLLSRWSKLGSQQPAALANT